MLEIIYFQVTDPGGWAAFQTLEHHNPSVMPATADERKLEKAFILFREAVYNCGWVGLVCFAFSRSDSSI